MAEIRSAIEAKEYQKAISLSSKYLVVGNQELLALNARAKEELAAAHKAEETEKLLSELKGVPTSEYENNLRLYQQLVTLNPNNQNYKSKVQFYTQKISEKNEKQRLAAEQKKKLEVRKDTGGMVSKSSFKGVWPLTIKEGTLACNNNAVTFKTIDGKVYAVNGTAKGRGAQEIDPIWKNNPDLPGAKLNISDLIKKGLSLCSKIGNETSALAPE